MKNSFLLVLLLFICFQNNVNAQDTLDSLKQSFEEGKKMREKTHYLILNPAKVKVIRTCSTRPELCGTMSFGSVCTVQLMNGEYSGDTIRVATTCTATNYIVGQTYKLNAHYGPGFSVSLCDGMNYSPGKQEDFIIFGMLAQSAFE